MLRSFTKRLPSVYWLVLIVIIIKSVLLPFAEVTDADAVSRSFISEQWMHHPVWMTEGQWAPFHFYLNGMFLWLWDDPALALPFLNILLSAFTLVPFYFFVRREFHPNGALIATIFLAIDPVLFRNSFMAMSETPYLFLLALSLNLLSKGMRNNSNSLIVISGLCFSLASGFRWEAGIVALILVCLLFFRKQWKAGLLLAFTAFIFIVYWSCQSIIMTDDILNSFQWAKKAIASNEIIELQSYLRRIWFFPFSWIIGVGLFPGYFILKYIFRSYKSDFRKKFIINWSIPFWIMLVIIICSCFRGVLLLQHRFSGILVLFSLPFISYYFEDLNKKKIRMAVLFAIFTLGCSFIFNTDGIKPLPRLKDRSIPVATRLIKNHLKKESVLMLDFIGWDNTYYIALNSGLYPDDIIILPEHDFNKEVIEEAFEHHQSGIVLARKKSALFSEIVFNENQFSLSFYPQDLTAEKIEENDKFILFNWEK